MPTPLELLTKPLQIGAQIATVAIQNIQQTIQGLLGGQRSGGPKPLDDATITAKVETTLFRDAKVDKGKIDVNTADGVVWLRGEARTAAQIKELEAKVSAVPEVKRVENLLHLPKTPAQKKARTTTTAAARKRTPKRTTAERKTTRAANAEPTPKELASKGEGRKPAPMGSSGNGSTAG